MEKENVLRGGVFLLTMGLVCFFLFGLWTEGEGQESKGALPRTLTLATHPSGTFANTLGTAGAIVISKHLPIQVKVMPTMGPKEWAPMVASGEVHIGVISQLDAQRGRLGEGEFKLSTAGKGAPTTLLCCSIGTQGGVVVAETSGIKKGSDLKGKRIAMDYVGSEALRLQGRAFVANWGLDWERDVKMTSATELVDAARQVIEGRADACGAGLGASYVVEIDASRGARFLSFDPSPEAVKRLNEFHPGIVVLVEPGPGRVGIKEPTYMHSADYYLAISEKLSDDVVYSIVKALWENDLELGKVHARLVAWKKEIFVTKTASIPYHPGAVKFYKEKGVWGAEMDKVQSQLLAKKPFEK